MKGTGPYSFKAFCRQAGHVFAENLGILPANSDLAGYQRDLATVDALRPRMVRLGKLHQPTWGVNLEWLGFSDKALFR